MTEDPDQQSDRQPGQASPSESVRIIIRFPDGDVDMVADRATVTWADIIAKVRQARPNLANRQIKLIYQGRFVTPATSIQSGVVGNRSQVYLLGSVGQILSDDELRREQLEAQAANYTASQVSVTDAPQGFDRLRAAGLSAEEVDNLRAQFGTMYGTSGPEQVELEEQWFDNAQTYAITEGNMAEMLVMIAGILMGVSACVIVAMGVLPPSQDRALRVGAFGGAVMHLLVWLYS